MQLVEPQTPAERFKAANDAMSEHCFKAGRLKYKIELDEEQVEKDKRELANMRMDFDKLRKEFIRAQQDLSQNAVTPEIPSQ